MDFPFLFSVVNSNTSANYTHVYYIHLNPLSSNESQTMEDDDYLDGVPELFAFAEAEVEFVDCLKLSASKVYASVGYREKASSPYRTALAKRLRKAYGSGNVFEQLPMVRECDEQELTKKPDLQRVEQFKAGDIFVYVDAMRKYVLIETRAKHKLKLKSWRAQLVSKIGRVKKTGQFSVLPDGYLVNFQTVERARPKDKEAEKKRIEKMWGPNQAEWPFTPQLHFERVAY